MSIYVDDEDKALRFCTDVLGLVKKEEFPVGADRWLTVVSPDEPDGGELSLVPDGHPAVRPFKCGRWHTGRLLRRRRSRR